MPEELTAQAVSSRAGVPMAKLAQLRGEHTHGLLRGVALGFHERQLALQQAAGSGCPS